MSQMNKTPEKELNKMETRNLDAEFKTLIIRMLKELRISAALKNDMETIKKEQVRNEGYTN